MRIITKPKVYLLATQAVNEEVLSSFFADRNIDEWMTDTSVVGQKLSEMAGRVCYESFAKPRPGGNKAYLQHIIECKHGSVLEHCVFSFVFTDVSRSLTHELVRHRTGLSFSQRSQRFVDESKTGFVEPSLFSNNEEMHKIWLDSVESSSRAYELLAEKAFAALEHITDKTMRRKSAREAARSVLPNACSTTIFVTINARAARHFIEMRCSRYADVEIRKLAMEMFDVLSNECPNIFADYEKEFLDDGTFEVHTKNQKV